MENQFEKYLKTLNTLSVNTTVWVFRRSFDNFYGSIKKLSLEQIDNWVVNLRSQNIEQSWVQQRQMTHPHIFFYGMLQGHKYETLNEKSYTRISSDNIIIPDSERDFNKYPIIAKKISKYILSLDFQEGVAFLGKLIGAWMLTCPEAIIRSEDEIERDAPIHWIKMVYSTYKRNQKKDNEMKLIFALDTHLHYAFTDYDVENI